MKNVIDNKTKQIFKSRDELFISWYLEELKQNGFIEDWSYEPEKILLTDEDSVKYRKVVYEQLQTKVKRKVSYHNLLGKHLYTYDFSILFNEKSKNIFYSPHTDVPQCYTPFILYNSLTSLIEVKFEKRSYQGSKAKTNISRKWVLQKTGLFVEEIRYKELFFNSFTPKRYINPVNEKIQIRKTFKTRTLEEYIKIRININKKQEDLKNKWLNKKD